MAKDDDPDAMANGRSIAERAADGDDGEPGEQAEIFPLGSIEGDAKTLKTLIRAGLPVTQTVAMGSAEVPISSGGLIDPDKEGMLLVTYEAAGYQPVPVREGERHEGKRVKSWKIRTHLRPIHVERIDGEAGVIEANFASLLDVDDKAAAALLDRLGARVKAKLADGKHPSRVAAAAGAGAST
jgi:hypothetical protein